MAKYLIHKEVPAEEHHHKADLSLHNKFIHEGEIFEGEADEAATYVALLHKTTGVCYSAQVYTAPVPEHMGSRRRG